MNRMTRVLASRRVARHFVSETIAVLPARLRQLAQPVSFDIMVVPVEKPAHTICLAAPNSDSKTEQQE